MKRIAVVIAAFFITVSAFAQKDQGKFTIYPRVGVNMYKFADDEVYVSDDFDAVKSKSKAGFTAGAEVQYQLGVQTAVSAGVLYSQQGTKWDLVDNTLKYTLHYINVPVMFVNYFGESGLAVKAGVQVGFLADAKYDSEGYEVIRDEDGNAIDMKHYEDSGSVDGQFNKVDFAIPVGISYEYMGFALDLRYNFGLKKTEKFLGKGYNRGFSLTLGYGF